MELHPNVEITWEKRSLQEFADYPINKLAEKYDLLVIDHPWAGFAAEKGVLVGLENELPAEYLKDQADNSVGKSYESYTFNDFQSALVIDAAAPIATYRPDLFTQEQRERPTTWEDVLELAKEQKIAYAGIPLNSLMDFYMLARTLGGELFNGEIVVDEDIGIKSLEYLRELGSYCPKEIFDWDPINVNEAMASRDDIYYCPFAYGYSNYSRDGYGKNIILATDLVELNGQKLISTLGGTGLAISNKCESLTTAVDYAAFTASPEIQSTLFFDSGGQPGHRAAWVNDEVNRRSHNYFKETLSTLDRAYLRPRYSGYFHFQDNGGDYVRDYVLNGGNPGNVLEKLNKLYRESLAGEQL